MTELAGKTALITGASRGIGASTARVLAAEGVAVVLAARNAAACEAEATAIEDAGGKAVAVACDVADPLQVVEAVQAAAQEFGGLDILINNAGAIEPVARMAESDPDAWSQIIDVNLKGVYYGMQAALPVMLASSGGTVITISSGAAHNALEGWSHYCTSKAGAHMLTKCLHKEYGDQGIRAMGLSPGTVATQMQREIKASGVNPVSQLDWETHIPADWPARTLAWMCGQDADGFLGEEISLRDEAIRRRVGLIS
ncbi:MAG: SDR family oxidoreductase [Pseudomonadota bacterium]